MSVYSLDDAEVALSGHIALMFRRRRLEGEMRRLEDAEEDAAVREPEARVRQLRLKANTMESPRSARRKRDNDPLVHQCAEATAQIMALTARLEVSEARAIEAEARAARLTKQFGSPFRWKSSTSTVR